MNKIKFIITGLFLSLITVSAQAQTVTRVCVQTNNTSSGASQYSCQDVSTTNPFPVVITPTSSAGANPTHLLSAATTNSTSIKAGPGTLYDINVINTNATPAFLKFYNTASAPTCNTTPVVQTMALIQNIPLTIPSSEGIAFSNGIGLCITGAAADNDNTNATTGITVSLTYK